jgi:hypothetical protein
VRCIHVPNAFLEAVQPPAGDEMPKHVARSNQIKMMRQAESVRAGKGSSDQNDEAGRTCASWQGKASRSSFRRAGSRSRAFIYKKNNNPFSNARKTTLKGPFVFTRMKWFEWE